MSLPTEWIESELADKLEVLRQVPPRDPGAAANGRAIFLSAAAQFADNTPARSQRPFNWRALVNSWMPLRQSLIPIRLALTSVVIILLVGFISLIPAARAASASLPGEPLYGLKLAIEDARLALAVQPEKRINISLDFADRRISEIEALAVGCKDIPANLANQLAHDLDVAFQAAGELSDAELVPVLERLRVRIESEERRLAQLTTGSTLGLPVLLRLRELVQIRLLWINAGIVAPQEFRNQLNLREGWEQTPEGLRGVPFTTSPTLANTHTPAAIREMTKTPQPTDIPIMQRGSSTALMGTKMGQTPTVVGTTSTPGGPIRTAMPTGTTKSQRPGPNPTAGGTQSGPGSQSPPHPPGGSQHP